MKKDERIGTHITRSMRARTLVKTLRRARCKTRYDMIVDVDVMNASFEVILLANRPGIGLVSSQH